MGIIKVALLDEEGVIQKEVQGDTHLLDAIVPDLDDERFHAVRFIDPYGDTVFNVLQWPLVKRELAVLRTSTRDLRARHVIDEVLELIANPESLPHTYLKFFGD